MSRRDLLRRMGIGAGALSLSAFLAACGTEGTAPSGGDEEEKDPPTTNQIQGELDFANWPLYIDKAGGQRPTLNDFTKATDIEVNYQEVIDDNQSFFGTIQEPLANGQETGWDLIVVTDWLIAKMISLGYLEQIVQDRIPNFLEHAGQIYQNRPYDPGNRYSLPWQSGMTGIGYNPKLTGPEITSTDDLFDPAFEGQVGMMTEMRDTMNLVLLNLGIEPQDATNADAEAAQKKLLEQRDAGIVRAVLRQRLCRHARTRRSRPHDGMVWRCLHPQAGQPGARVRGPGRGRHPVDRQHGHSAERGPPGRRDGDDELRLPA